MSKFGKRKKFAVALVVASVVLGGGSIAYAYWSTTGTGTGSGTTSDGASDLVITQTSTISGLAPDVAAETISGTVKNNAKNSAHVTSVTVSIASVTKAAGAVGACTATDYTLGTATMNVNTDIAAGATAKFTGATIKFNSTTSNQDGCKGATVALAYTST